MVRAIDAFDFYPTPPKYAQQIYDDIHNKSSYDVYDIASGLGSLSLPFIEDPKEHVESLTMIEFNEDFYKLLKPLENIKNIKVIEGDFFRLEPSIFKKSKNYGRRPLFICNPPFKGVNRLFLNHKKFKAQTDLFYLDFLFRIIHFGKQLVADNDEFYIYIIMPKTYFQKDERNINSLDIIPQTVLERNYHLYPDLFIDNNYESDEENVKKKRKVELSTDFIYQMTSMGDVEGFRTLRGGKPAELKLTVGLYKLVIM